MSGGDSPKLSIEDLGGLKNKKEASGKEELSVEQLVQQSNAIVESYGDKVKDLPDNFKSALHDNVVQYFLTSADRYDSDTEKGLDATEFRAYSDNMLVKLRGILDQYAPSKEQLEAREKQKEAAADAQKAVDGMGDVERSDIELNPANLGTPEGVQEELMKFNQRGESFRTQAGDMMGKVGKFQQAYSEYEESKLGLKVLYQGTILGKLTGWASEEADGLRTTLDGLKKNLDSNVSKLQGEQTELENHGKQMNQAGDNLKIRTQTEKADKLASVKNRSSELDQSRLRDKEKHNKIQNQQVDLNLRRGLMSVYMEGLRNQANDARKSQDELIVKKDELDKFGGMVEDSLSVLNTALRSDKLPEQQRMALEEKRDELMDRKDVVSGGVKNVDELRGSVVQADAQTEDMISQVQAGTVDIDAYLSTMVGPALSSLDESIRSLEIAKLQNGSQAERIEAEYMMKTESIDGLDALVADNVLDNNLANKQMLGFLESQKQFIDNVDIENVGIWDATGGFVLGNLGRGLNFLSTDVYGRVQDLMIDITKDVPVLNVATEVYANFTMGIASGVLAGAGDLVSGLDMLVDKPTMVLKGMGALIGRDPNTGEFDSGTAGNAWKEMGKALVAWDDFKDGDWGKGVGKIGFNVLLTATGVGVAGDAAKGAAAVTYVAAREMGAGALNAGLRAGAAGAKAFVVETSAGLAELPGKIIGAPGRMVKALTNSVPRNILADMSKLDLVIAEMPIVKRFPELASKSAKELAALEKQPVALIRMGIDDANTYKELVALKKAKIEFEGLASYTGRSSGRIVGQPEARPGRQGGASMPREGSALRAVRNPNEVGPRVIGSKIIGSGEPQLVSRAVPTEVGRIVRSKIVERPVARIVKKPDVKPVVSSPVSTSEWKPMKAVKGPPPLPGERIPSGVKSSKVSSRPLTSRWDAVDRSKPTLTGSECTTLDEMDTAIRTVNPLMDSVSIGIVDGPNRLMSVTSVGEKMTLPDGVVLPAFKIIDEGGPRLVAVAATNDGKILLVTPSPTGEGLATFGEVRNIRVYKNWRFDGGRAMAS